MKNTAHYRKQFIASFLRWSLIIVLFVTLFLLWGYVQKPQWTTGVLFLTFCQFPPFAIWCMWLLRRDKTERVLPIYLTSGLIACNAFIIFMPDTFLLVGAIGYILFIRVTIFLRDERQGAIFAAVCAVFYLTAIFIRSTFTLPPIDFFQATDLLLYTLPVLTFVLFTSIDRIGTRYLRDALQFSEQARQNLTQFNTRLIEQTKQLEQSRAELSEFAVKLEHKNAELQLANEEAKSFAYIISHDLRAPLVNLKGFSGELKYALETVKSAVQRLLPQLEPAEQQRVRYMLEEDVPESLTFIDNSVTRMERLINALLRLSRYGRRDMDFKPINLQEIVEETLQALAHQITEREITVDVDPLPVVTADFVSMEQIISNLLSNAINYLAPNRPGHVKIYAQSNEAETTIFIEDNGRGIAPHNMHKLFEPFRRIDTHDVPGEGMGLTYVQTLVRRHNGRIWCESELGQGSTFIFTIPKDIEELRGGN